MPGQTEILAHLKAVLADRRFATAERNSRFLQYIVEQALQGNGHEIKETVIAAEVYGREADYDPKKDSIVRVEATRLRQKLRAYYEAEGQASRLRINVPSGSYVPRFDAVDDGSGASEPDALDAAPAIEAPPAVIRQREALWPFAALALATVFVAWAVQPARAPSPEAKGAWEEAVALLNLDPHTAETTRGAPATLRRAAERLEFAVARDPGFAQAWATLAEAQDYLFAFVDQNPKEIAARAEAAALRAVALEPQLAAGHHMLGLVRWQMQWNFKAAEASYRRALELNPRNVFCVIELADLLRQTGRGRDAANLVASARRLQPAASQLAVKQAELAIDLGDTEEAASAAQEALSIQKNDARALVAAGFADELRGDTESALARYRLVLDSNPTDRRALPAYGHLLGRLGKRAEAEAVLRELQRINGNVRNSAFQVSVVYAGLGDTDRALDWLERARRTHQTHFPFAAVEPRLRGLHRLNRFHDLVNLTGYVAPGSPRG